MEEIEKLLTNPFNEVKENDLKGFQDKCKDIAEDLFCNYCIKCNGKEYYFAEIEFYYYDSNLYLKNKEQFKWQEVTYARNGYKAKDLFYHLSGIDICFESSYNEQGARFGGILIRAIKEVNDENSTIIAGPLNCKDEILNACKGGKMPSLRKVSKKRKLSPKPTYRALGKNDIDIENDRLCFFDSQIRDWNPMKDKYETKRGIIVPKKGSYKTDRFNQ